MKLENGKIYLVNHSRKGTFAMRVSRQCATWVRGVIIGGKASAMLDYNEKIVGEDVSVRVSLIQSAIRQL